MAKVGAHKQTPRNPSPAVPADFDQELADLNATLARLEASLDTPQPEITPAPEAPKHRGRPRKGAGAPGTSPISPVAPDAEATPMPSRPAPSAPAPAAPAAAPAVNEPPPALPTGTDLSDPKNFGLMPPAGELDQGTFSDEEYRQRLGRHLAFATTVLHTSKVPAAVWREWRGFEKTIQQRLHDIANRAPQPSL